MARNMYGATSADFTLTSGGRPVPGSVLTLYTARTGGVQITDLLDVNSAACTTVTSGADGSVVYYGPNNDKTVHWADAGQGARVAIRPTDITGDPPVMSIGTVTTGTAAATLTGTSEAPVLNLTLPSAGANGVDTAAIQDGAVTAAKMQRQVGNLLTENQAKPTTTGAWSILSNVTETSAGAFSFGNTGVCSASSYITGLTAGETYTVRGKLTMVGRSAAVAIIWRDSGGTSLSTVVGNYVAAGASGVSQVTAVAPVGTASARVFPIYSGSGAASGDTAVTTEVSFHKGTGGQWALPGTPILGLTDAPIGNLLPLNVATGTDASGDTTGFTSSGCTLSSETSGAYQGGRFLRATWALGSASVYTTLIPVAPGETYTATQMVKSADFTGTNYFYIYWYQSDGTTAASTASNLTSSTVTTSWQRQTLTAVAPANAAYAKVRLLSGLTSAGEVSFDAISFHRGAGGKWQLPGVPVTGQSEIAVNGAVHLSGTGTPEGVVTAAPGSTWLQTDATTDVKGWIRWVKASGTGNTGWVAGPEADTGWRNVSADVGADFSVSDKILIRRQGSRVTVQLRNVVRVTNSGNRVTPSTVYTLPTGFRQTSYVDFGACYVQTLLGCFSTGGDLDLLAVRSTGTWAANDALWGEGDFLTDDTWPTSLPGSAA